MKKLLILVLILGLTSATYAVGTLDITVNDQPYAGGDVYPSDIIKVVWNTTLSAFGGYAGLDFDVSLGDYEADSFSTLQAPPLIGTDLGPVDTANGMAIQGGNAGTPHPAGWLFEFEFHVPEGTPYSTIIILDALAGGYNYQQAAPGAADGWPYAEIHVVPEPMTIALLGLGGLFLRRRK